MASPTATYARKWGDEEEPPAPVPTILVSSLDDAPVPGVPAAERLAKAAEARGWTARLTYALADIPDRVWLNGELAKPAHRLASVAVRLARGAARAWATWHSIDGGAWRFAVAYLGLERLGLRELTARLAVTS